MYLSYKQGSNYNNKKHGVVELSVRIKFVDFPRILLPSSEEQYLYILYYLVEAIELEQAKEIQR